MINIIKYIQYLLLTACVAQNLALGMYGVWRQNMPTVTFVPVTFVPVPNEMCPNHNAHTTPPTHESSSLNPNAAPFVPGIGSSDSAVGPQTNEAERGVMNESVAPEIQPKLWADIDSDDGQSSWDSFPDRAVYNPYISSLKIICDCLPPSELEKMKDFFKIKQCDQSKTVLKPLQKHVDECSGLSRFKFLRYMIRIMPKGKIRDSIRDSMERISKRPNKRKEPLYIFYLPLGPSKTTPFIIYIHDNEKKSSFFRNEENHMIFIIHNKEKNDEPAMRQSVAGLCSSIDDKINYEELCKICEEKAKKAKEKAREEAEEKAEDCISNEKSELWSMFSRIFNDLHLKQNPETSSGSYKKQ